jgi:ubiquinone/menaquinone biosynthesis C-methylase UbiE
MTHQGSYNVGSFASDTQAEIRRLNAQVDLFWPAEGELLIRHGLRDGMRVLDCGCGPGRLLELLKRRLPKTRCVGVEIDPLLVETAQKHLAACELADCTVQQGAAEDPSLPPESFDFIVTRLVLEHVPDPSLALRGLRSLLKPGGKIAVISNDFDFHLRTFPPVSELDDMYSAYCTSRRNDHGDPCIGRRMPHLLIESGFRLLACEIEVAHNAMIGDTPFLKSEGGGIPAQLVDSGFLKDTMLDAMTRSWRQMLVAPVHSIARPLWVAIGERRDEVQPSSGTSARGETAGRAVPAIPEAAEGLGETSQPLLDRIVKTVAKVIGRAPINSTQSMSMLGVDSLSAILIQERIKVATGVEIPIVYLLGDTPLTRLAVMVEERKAGVVAQKEAEPSSHQASTSTVLEEGEI